MNEDELWVYIDGNYLRGKDAKISVFDHCFLYGDGVFEGIRAYNGRVFKLDEHIERLYNSAKAIFIEPPLTKEEMKKVIIECLRKNGLKDAYIRPIISRGTGTMGLDPRGCRNPTVVIITMPWGKYYGDLYDKGIKVATSPYRAIPPDCFSPSIKACQYLPNIISKAFANFVGADEALRITKEGFVAEGTGDNIFLVNNNTLKTPPSNIVLKGITREIVIDMAKKEGLKVSEENITLYELYTADEVFLTGTAAEIVPVVEIDGIKIGKGVPGKITKRFMKLYEDLTKKEGVPIYEEV